MRDGTSQNAGAPDGRRLIRHARSFKCTSVRNLWSFLQFASLGPLKLYIQVLRAPYDNGHVNWSESTHQGDGPVRGVVNSLALTRKTMHHANRTSRINTH